MGGPLNLNSTWKFSNIIIGKTLTGVLENHSYTAIVKYRDHKFYDWMTQKIDNVACHHLVTLLDKEIIDLPSNVFNSSSTNLVRILRFCKRYCEHKSFMLAKQLLKLIHNKLDSNTKSSLLWWKERLNYIYNGSTINLLTISLFETLCSSYSKLSG